MKKFKFNKITKIITALVFTIGLSGTIAVFAASTPSLGVAGTFGILSSTFTRNIGVTTIGGDLGYTTLSGGTTHTVSGSTHVADATYSNAGTDQGLALVALNGEACDFTFAPGAVDLATDTTHVMNIPSWGSVAGEYYPGVYCTSAASAASVGTAGITLKGVGTYIFRVNGALTTVDNSNVRLSDSASSCDVFWTPTSATTLGANTTFIGTVIDDAGITVGHSTSWNGRALAFGGTVTTDTDVINSACTTSNPTSLATLSVTKVVINDNGGNKVASDFPLFVGGTSVVSGVINSFSVGTYAITETTDSSYAQTFSGDCDANGNITLASGSSSVCTITNNDIAPTSSGSGIVYGCKDPNATNYNYFSASNPALCEYSNVSTVVIPSVPSLPVTPLVIIPKLPKTGFAPENQNTQWYVVLFNKLINLIK